MGIAKPDCLIHKKVFGIKGGNLFFQNSFFIYRSQLFYNLDHPTILF